MATVTKYIDVDIDLDDFSTAELIEEIANRKSRKDETSWYGNLPLSDLIDILKAQNCPDEILNPLKEWAQTPLINQQKLERWKSLCL